MLSPASRLLQRLAFSQGDQRSSVTCFARGTSTAVGMVLARGTSTAAGSVLASETNAAEGPALASETNAAVGPALAGKLLLLLLIFYAIVQTPPNATWVQAEWRSRGVGRAAWMPREPPPRHGWRMAAGPRSGTGVKEPRRRRGQTRSTSPWLLGALSSNSPKAK